VASENHIYKLSNAGGFKAITRYPDMLAGNTVWNPWSPTGAYDALATVTAPSGGVASITFAGIPTGYKHLQVRALGRLTGNANNCTLKINDDSGSNYSFHQLYGDGGSAGAGGNGFSTPSSSPNFNLTAASATAGNFGVGIMDILDYTNTSKLKTIRTLTGHDTNGGGYVIARSALWNSTSAVTSITFTPDSGYSFAQYSQFALYGVK